MKKSDSHGRENLAPPWQKGQSGNPGGRPKEKLITDAVRKKCGLTVKEFFSADEIAKYKLERFVLANATVAELIADRMVRAAIAGNSDGSRILRELLDRLEGRVPLPLMGVEGGEFVLNLVSHIPRPNRDPKPKKLPKPTKKTVQ